MSTDDTSAVRRVSVATLQAWLADGGELALLDAREQGVYHKSHLFHAASVPLSQLELVLEDLVPRRDTRVVWCDDGEGLARLAAQRMAGLMHMTGEPDDRNAPTTSSIDCPANIPPELNVRLAMVWAKFAPAMSNMFVTTKVAAGVVD